MTTADAEPEAGAGLTLGAPENIPGGRLWPMTGDGTVSVAGQASRIITGADSDAAPHALHAFGQPLRGWSSQDLRAVFIGQPDLFGGSSTGALHRLRRDLATRPVPRRFGGFLSEWRIRGELAARIAYTALHHLRPAVSTNKEDNMNSNLAAAIGRELDQTCPANPADATHIIQAALAGSDAPDRPAILAALARSLAMEFVVDPSRVFAAGLSADGAMAAILVATLPEVFRAVGIHSGLRHGPPHAVVSAFSAMHGEGPTKGCAAPAVPSIVLQGAADATVHPSNAARIVAGAAGDRVHRHDLSSGERRCSRSDTTGANGASITELWLIERAGHAWSGGAREGSYIDPRGPDTSSEMVVRFFPANSKRATA